MGRVQWGACGKSCAACGRARVVRAVRRVERMRCSVVRAVRRVEALCAPLHAPHRVACGVRWRLTTRTPQRQGDPTTTRRTRTRTRRIRRWRAAAAASSWRREAGRRTHNWVVKNEIQQSTNIDQWLLVQLYAKDRTSKRRVPIWYYIAKLQFYIHFGAQYIAQIARFPSRFI